MSWWSAQMRQAPWGGRDGCRGHELAFTHLLHFSDSLSVRIKKIQWFEGWRAFSMRKCSATIIL